MTSTHRVFTDDDLKRLKEAKHTDGFACVSLSWEEREALIARLEAAERAVLDLWAKEMGEINDLKLQDYAYKSYDAWLKAKGAVSDSEL